MAVNAWQTQLKMIHPIIQAPMAGVTTPEFVAASAESGVLGSIGAGYLSAKETRRFIQEVRKLTSNPFAVNLFVPDVASASSKQLQVACEALAPIRQKLQIPSQKPRFSKSEYNEQIQVIVDEKVKVCSFTFGLPATEQVKLLKEQGVFLIGTATTVNEAKRVEEAGLDAVVIQGSEAGGHRGSFTRPLQLIALRELLSDALQAVQIPIIAAGGIANKEKLDSLLSMGASAVQIGTALLLADESGANSSYKNAIAEAKPKSTVITTVFSGKAARGIQNSFMKEMKDQPIAPYPYQNDLTKEIRRVAAEQGNPEYISLWAGEQVHLNRKGAVQEIIKTFV